MSLLNNQRRAFIDKDPLVGLKAVTVGSEIALPSEEQEENKSAMHQTAAQVLQSFRLNFFSSLGRGRLRQVKPGPLGAFIN